MSSLIQSTPPAFEPITLAEAKAWLRVDANEEDALILGLIAAARTYIETFTRRSLCTQSFELSLDGFPAACLARSRYAPVMIRQRSEIVLPRPPLVSVTSITYVDEAGVTQTLDSDDYIVDTRATPGCVVLTSESSWPATADEPNAVIVSYVAGYGTPSAVPTGLRTALRFLLSHWFEIRGPGNVGNIVNEVPMSVEALLWQHRLPSFA